MCRSRGAHVACTRMYNGQGARKKIRPCMCTYGQGLKCLLAHTYGEGSLTWLGRNGETASSSCSWGGNEMRRVHGEATECVVFIGRQRGWVGTECVVVFIGRAWTEEAMETRPGVPHNGGNGPPTVEMGVLLIGRGVAYRTTEETDLLRSKQGSC